MPNSDCSNSVPSRCAHASPGLMWSETKTWTVSSKRSCKRDLRPSAAALLRSPDQLVKIRIEILPWCTHCCGRLKSSHDFAKFALQAGRQEEDQRPRQRFARECSRS